MTSEPSRNKAMVTNPDKIIVYPNQSLRSQTIPVECDGILDDEINKLIDRMFVVLSKTSNGLALAANQIGSPYRLFVLKPEFAEENDLPSVLLNPAILNKGPSKVTEPEGCLSIPGFYEEVSRYNTISVRIDIPWGWDMSNKELHLSGLAARVFQHEIDHLDGKLFIDLIDRKKKFEIRSILLKRR